MERARTGSTQQRRGSIRISAVGATLFAFAVALNSDERATAGSAPPGTATAISSGQAVSPAEGRLAHTATSATILTVDSGPASNRIAAYVGPSGRLTLTSPEGIKVPSTPAGQCIQDSAVQISCDPGYVQVIAGDLGAGDDTFAASADLPAMVGAVIDGQRRPLSGGPGRDRIVGGAAADLLEGGLGGDSLIGGGGDDLLIGGGGADRLRGGRGRDALFGGNGRDKLDGGPGRDLWDGGPGRDVAAGCAVLRSVP